MYMYIRTLCSNSHSTAFMTLVCFLVIDYSIPIHFFAKNLSTSRYLKYLYSLLHTVKREQAKWYREHVMAGVTNYTLCVTTMPYQWVGFYTHTYNLAICTSELVKCLSHGLDDRSSSPGRA
jgi:hypothetical protein